VNAENPALQGGAPKGSAKNQPKSTSAPQLLRDTDEWTPLPLWIEGVLTDEQLAVDNDVWLWEKLVLAVKLPGVAKSIALVLASHCRREQTNCWTSIDTLAMESGWSRDPVMRALKNDLEPAGLVVVWREKNDTTKRQKHNVYDLAWPFTPIVLATRTARPRWRPKTTSRVAEEDPAGSAERPGLVAEEDPGRVAEEDRKYLEDQGSTEGTTSSSRGASLAKISTEVGESIFDLTDQFSSVAS